jgi:hypothetical protein
MRQKRNMEFHARGKNMALTPLDQPGHEETLQSVLDELTAVERQVVAEQNITTSAPRLEIVCRLSSGTIAETEAVSRWIGLYSSLTRWLLEDDGPPVQIRHRKSSAEAAESGLFF